MPTIQAAVTVTVATWICNWCGRHSTAGASVPAELVVQHFVDTLGWRLLDIDTDVVACDRCRTQPDIRRMTLTNDRNAS